MDSSGSHSPAGETVTLSNFFCHGENLFIEVETTAPPPKRKSRRRRCSKKRLSGHAAAISRSDMGMSSPSSPDGGDEYSSEASEYDTYGMIPAWIKQELKNSESERREGHEDEDLSGASDDERVSSLPEQDSSMSSIHINKDMNHGNKVKEKSDQPNQDGKESAKPSKKTSKDENSIDMKVESFSSSSASFVASLSTREKGGMNRVQLQKPLLQPPKKSGTVARKVTAPPTFKSKIGPPLSQKPLNRIRAQSKVRMRNCEPSKDGPMKAVSADNQQTSSLVMQTELQRVMEEKERAETRLRRLEEEHRLQQDRLRQEAEARMKEREHELKEEILNLRTELKQQSHQLQDNHNVVLSLQDKLEKVQCEQQRLSACSESSRQAVRESKICTIQ